jgi:peroxiredoxin
MKDARSLEDLNLLDPEGQPVRLGDFWRDRPVLLVFIRHFGCLFCRDQVHELRGVLDRIRAAGTELVVVGNGRPWFAKAFRDSEGLDFPLVVDPDLVAYRAAGLRRGLLDTLGPRSLMHAVKAFSRGHRQGKVQGDPWQNGGAFLVQPDGKVTYRHISREAGDHAPLDAVLQALEGLGTGNRPTAT